MESNKSSINSDDAESNTLSKDLDLIRKNIGSVHQHNEASKALLEETLKIVKTNLNQLEEKEKTWNQLQQRVQEFYRDKNQKITLNIGGKLFTTTKKTLSLIENTFFTAQIGSGRWEPDEDGQYFIDRNPKMFPYILDYFRGVPVPFNRLDKYQIEDLRMDADFYCIESLIQLIVLRTLSFDPNRKSNNVTLSDKNKTATNSGTVHSSVLVFPAESYCFGKGIHTWKIKINFLAGASHWIAVGVCPSTCTDFQNITAGISLTSQNNLYYQSGASVPSTASGDWVIGDKIKVVLNNTANTLQITNLRTTRLQVLNLNKGVSYIPWFNLHNAKDSITLLSYESTN